MSLTKDELGLLENLTQQVASLREQIGAYEQAVIALNGQNAQLSEQINSLNGENKRLSEWVAQVSQQVHEFHNAGAQSEQRLTVLIQQLASALK